MAKKYIKILIVALLAIILCLVILAVNNIYSYRWFNRWCSDYAYGSWHCNDKNITIKFRRDEDDKELANVKLNINGELQKCYVFFDYGKGMFVFDNPPNIDHKTLLSGEIKSFNENSFCMKICVCDERLNRDFKIGEKLTFLKEN